MESAEGEGNKDVSPSPFKAFDSIAKETPIQYQEDTEISPPF